MNTKTDLLELEGLERAASNRADWKTARILRQASAEIRDLRIALGNPVPETKGTAALVLFFAEEHERVEFLAVAQQAWPNLKGRDL